MNENDLPRDLRDAEEELIAAFASGQHARALAWTVRALDLVQRCSQEIQPDWRSLRRCLRLLDEAQQMLAANARLREEGFPVLIGQVFSLPGRKHPERSEEVVVVQRSRKDRARVRHFDGNERTVSLKAFRL